MFDLAFPSDRPGREVSVEDDGRVVWAYLHAPSPAGIVSDVWLYTSGPTPDEREWDRLDATVRGPLFVDGTRSARLVPGAKPGCREWHDVTAPALAFCSVNAASRTAIDRASACPSERHGEVGVNPRPAHASGFYVAATAMASISICSSGSASEVTSTIVSAG